MSRFQLPKYAYFEASGKKFSKNICSAASLCSLCLHGIPPKSTDATDRRICLATLSYLPEVND